MARMALLSLCRLPRLTGGWRGHASRGKFLATPASLGILKRYGLVRDTTGLRKPGAMELITLKDIYKTYFLGEVDVPVLKGVTLEIGKGEFVALMGSSGSGKTTLMNILGCLDRPTAGEYWLDGEEISHLTPEQRADVRNRKIGFVFQSFNLLARTSALENVTMPLDYAAHHINESEGVKRGKRLLELVGLGHRMDHHPRSLVNQPSLLLADEPTGNLDSTTTDEILTTFRKLNDDEGITIVIVTHEADVAAHCKRIVRMRDGRIEDKEHEIGFQAAVPPPH